MSKKLLITCGCSWTYGKGVCWEPNMLESEFNRLQLDSAICDQYSFRGILAKRHNFDTVNFAVEKSSNQRQFRLLKSFFVSEHGKKALEEYSSIVVLHGITSTTRNELYVNEHKQLYNFKADLELNKEWCQAYIKYFYNHKASVDALAEEMNFFNIFYKKVGIKNLWFDTFNHHEYPTNIDNFLNFNNPSRDLASSAAIYNGFNDKDCNYFTGSRKCNDTDRIGFLRGINWVNPFSLHPTKQAHEFIANLIDVSLADLIK